ncbi:MAG: hypothetical protein DMG61_14560 [Acidobacteria bacterium]|nr:MAG: hypothetical protein DMG61_14560 [Acidobacteriota bacterium]PYY14396.1 MAG: hypothetical protein DMG60_20120 [Acidobacteriota bacterium]
MDLDLDLDFVLVVIFVLVLISLLRTVILRPDFGRRISRDVSVLIAVSRHFGKNLWPKSRDAAIKP